MTSLDLLFSQSSLKILRHGSLEILSQMLNPRKILPTPNRKLRDYRGVAESAGFTPGEEREVENAGSAGHMRKLVQIWCARKDGATVRDLWKALEEIERFDVQDEAAEVLAKDCEMAIKTIGAENTVRSTLSLAIKLG